MKKRTKRMMVAILAAAVIAAVPAANIVPVLLTASAANVTLPEKTNLQLVTETGNLTVQIPDNVSNSYTVKAYEMLQLVIAKDSKWTDGTKMTNDENSTNIYVVTDEFAPLFEEAKNDYNADNANGEALRNADKLYLEYDNDGKKLLISSKAPAGKTKDKDYVELDNAADKKTDKTYFEASIISKLTGSKVDPTETEASAVRLFSDWATRYVKAKSLDADAIAEKIDTKFKFEALVYGYYVIVTSDDTTDNDKSVINQSILNVPQAANVKLKASPITVDKSVDNFIDANNKNNGNPGDELKKSDSTRSDEHDKITANIGDILQYKVESHIPALTSYVLTDKTKLVDIDTKLTENDFTDNIKNKFVYTFRDTMKNQDFIPAKVTDTTKYGAVVEGLKMEILKSDKSVEATYYVKEFSDAYYLFEKDAEVKKENAIGRLWETDYAKVGDVYQNFFAINFNLKKLKDEGLDGKDVVFTYNAELKGEAGNNDATNEAKFTYSNDPYDNTSTDTIEDSDIVYTYDFKVDKLFSDGATSLYGKVKFKLYSQDSSHTDRTAIRFKYTDGIYVRVDSDDVSTLESPIDQDGIIAVNTTDGTLRLRGLGEGTYYLEEQSDDDLTKAGYNTLNPITITISAKDKEKKIIDSDDFDLFNGNSTAVTAKLDEVPFTPGKIGGNDEYGIEFNVVNQKGFKLPFTGEFGNWALAISGILLVAVGGTVIVLVNRKKKDSSTDNEK